MTAKILYLGVSRRQPEECAERLTFHIEFPRPPTDEEVCRKLHVGRSSKGRFRLPTYDEPSPDVIVRLGERRLRVDVVVDKEDPRLKLTLKTILSLCNQGELAISRSGEDVAAEIYHLLKRSKGARLAKDFCRRFVITRIGSEKDLLSRLGDLQPVDDIPGNTLFRLPDVDGQESIVLQKISSIAYKLTLCSSDEHWLVHHRAVLLAYEGEIEWL